MAGPDQRHPHLPLPRSEPVNERRTRNGFGKRGDLDTKRHGEQLAAELDAALTTPAQPGYDERRLLKLSVEGISRDLFENIPGLELVSQEGKEVVLLFASKEGQREFRSRLRTMADGGQPTRQDILIAIHGVSFWTREDRLGLALRAEGVPASAEVIVDVELWPLEKRQTDRVQMIASFEAFCTTNAAEILDSVNQETLVLKRIRCSLGTLNRFLEHRDVRTVDLPPRVRLAESDLQISATALGTIPAPPTSAPVVAVLDSGVVTNHPLLAPAMGDAQSFLAGRGPEDENGHGTAVAGLALYGEALARKEPFVPLLRIVSGRITDEDAQSQATDKFLENQITEAVDAFLRDYGCRVFNLSFGDERKPFSGGRVRGLAATIDTLSRTRNVLFVVSAGNFRGGPSGEPKWKSDYPGYLLEEESRILDPAPALNALTVGSVARYDVPRGSQRYPEDPAHQSAVPAGFPSPFSRTGPGPGGAIKPDVVAFGGNYAVDLRVGERRLTNALLGEPAPAHDFVGGHMLRDFVGTSFAAPHVAHIAGRLLSEYPSASPNLLRALIVAHAAIPKEAHALGLETDDLRSLVGYGQPQRDRCLFSTERCVSLITEDRLPENRHHFYEVPLPPDFLIKGRRHRAITVAIAHAPAVRTTRAGYRCSQFTFRLVAASSLNDLLKIYRKTTKDEREKEPKEFREPSIGLQLRSKGTVQTATYDVKASPTKEKVFVVLTRTVPEWAGGLVPEEPYALVVTLEDRSEQEVRYYTQLRATLRERVRV